MRLCETVLRVTERIIYRSEVTRNNYEKKVNSARSLGVKRSHLSCGNQAHAYASMGADKSSLTKEKTPNIGIVSAYNDMLSAHQPFKDYPNFIKEVARQSNASAQVAGGVPAMCDGVTQGQIGMELSLFSRDVIALASSIALSHNVFDGHIFLGVCDKIVPGLVMSALSFGHIPAIFIPAGPMTSGLGNEKKSAVRQKFASGEINREELMEAEMDSYHSPGTCTFYGTANTNQMLMEFMGLQLPGSSFVNPGTPLRDALTAEATKQIIFASKDENNVCAVSEILDARAFVNGIVGLNATGGSTNLLIHLIAMAKTAGLIINWEDFADLSEVTPLMARIYPNGLADVNHFHAAGGLTFLFKELLGAGLLHKNVKTVMGAGLEKYLLEPKLIDGQIVWSEGTPSSYNKKILVGYSEAFQPTGGLKHLSGNLGSGVMKISSVEQKYQKMEAPARIFHNQNDVKTAFENGAFISDTVVVVRYQGPKANGMPELHSLTPLLTILQKKGLKIALVTDGRMSGASGKVPAVIHVCPEALDAGPIAQLQDGDIIKIDAQNGSMLIKDKKVLEREISHPDLNKNSIGMGRELFINSRNSVSSAEDGASFII